MPLGFRPVGGMEIIMIKENNLKALADRYPFIADKLEEYVCENSSIQPFISDVCKRDVLALNYNDEVMLLDTTYDEEQYLSDWFDTVEIPNAIYGKIVLFGLGNGMFARKLSACIPKDFIILVEEPSVEIFKTVLEAIDISDVLRDERILIHFGFDEEIGIRPFYEEILNYEDFASIMMLNYPNYGTVYTDEWRALVKVLQSVHIRKYTDLHYYEAAGKGVVNNEVRNVSEYLKSYALSELLDKVKSEIPAVVVACGPSLEKNIDKLKGAKGKSIIIATDSALNVMYKHGIVPDVAIAIDPIKDRKYMAYEELRHVPMIVSTSTNHDIIEYHLGRKFFYSVWGYIYLHTKNMGKEVPTLDTGGSVANNAMSLAMLLGCKKIILLGQDLAYTDSKTHSDGSVRGEAKEAIEDAFWDVDIYGNEIQTSSMFVLFKEWIEDTISENKDIQVIDATEGGILIKGTEIITLEEAVKKYCVKPFSCKELFDKAGNLFTEEESDRFKEDIRKLPNTYEEILRDLDRLDKQYDKMAEMIEKNKFRCREFIDLSRKANEMLDGIEANPSIEYLQNLVQSDFIKMFKSVNMIEKDERAELKSVVEISKNHLRTLKKGIQLFNPLLNIMLDEIG